MVVARFAELERAVLRNAADGDNGHLGLDEIGQGQVLRLADGVGNHDAEGDALFVAPRRVEGQAPDGRQIEAPEPPLHVAPVAADVEHVDERQAGHALDVLLERLASGARGERRTGLFPGVAYQAEAIVGHGALGGAGGGDGEPAVVLLDGERPLVQSVAHARARTEVISRPEVGGHVGPQPAGRQTKRRRAADPIPSAHDHSLQWGQPDRFSSGRAPKIAGGAGNGLFGCGASLPE